MVENETAIVTGASSGIGKAISEMLCKMGYHVYGIGRDFSKSKIEPSDKSEKNGIFEPIILDLLHTEEVIKKMKEIRKNERVTLLVNNAGVGYYGFHEELNIEKIQQMIRTNLEIPMILCNFWMRELKKEKGMIVMISSVTADQTNPHGAVYGATKAGLSSFARSIFEESRKHGVQVVEIKPDMTQTELYRNADFEASSDEGAYLLPQDVSRALKYVLEEREGMVINEIKIKPQYHRIQKKIRKT